MIQIATIHLVILSLFTMATTMLMVVTVSNALRLRNVEITWKAGKLGGYPLFSTIFLGFSLFMTAFLYVQQLYQYTVPMFCYSWIGFNWFISSFLMSKRFITDHGIVKNINDPSQTIAWNRIMDYVVRNDGKHQTYIFFYPEYLPGESSRNIRLELEIPEGKQLPFGRILQKKLGRRFSQNELESTGIKQLK
ncbi:MAG: hypothetical protein WD097_04380 [Balneolales bacterium]